METIWAMATAGQWQLIADYMAQIQQVLDAKEAIIVPGTPADKPIK